ncbi:hypothetical protein MMC13_005968 [Lambiella insularis]|nr:hypothetical protein [Lambiella insularis]
MLRLILLQERPKGSALSALRNLEVIASVVGKQLQLVFRNNISGIYQRLGEITLIKDEDHEIDTIAWVHDAISRANGLEAELGGLSNRFQEQSLRIQELTQKLDALAESRKQQDSALLEKFEKILNKKKLKIRDQQRLLATAKVSANIGMSIATTLFVIWTLSVVTAQLVQKSRSPSENNESAISRTNKRKPKDEPATSQSDSENPGFEKMAVENLDATTPERSDLDTTSNEDDLDGEHSARAGDRGIGSKGKALEVAAHEIEVEEPPPRRELPFGKIGGRKAQTENEPIAAKQSKQVEDPQNEPNDDGEETSDDEL